MCYNDATLQGTYSDIFMFLGTCSFEHPNICNWETPIPPYQQIQWSRKSLSTISKPPSLLGDHTYNTKYGKCY